MNRTLLPLWDFGWVDYGPITLKGMHDPKDAPAAYIRSDEFRTSFVGPRRDEESDIHGPFRRDALSAIDFIPLTLLEFRSKVALIRLPEGFTEPASEEQWKTVESLVSDLVSQSVAIYMLRFTEKDHTYFHEWGNVLTIFREFLFISPDLSTTRVVFGYD